MDGNAEYGGIPAEPPLARPDSVGLQRSLSLIILVALSQNLAIMDFSSANVSAAAIMRAWQAQPVVAQWVLTVGQLTLGAFLIVAGRVADGIGQKKAFTAGCLCYATGNLIAALGPSLIIVIGGRALGGVGIALFNTAILSLATRSLPIGRERTLALAMFGIFTSVGGALGVVLGGAMVTNFGWRSVFLLTASLGFVNLLLALKLLAPTAAARAGRSVDIPGALLITLVSGLLVFTVMATRFFGWQSTVTIGSGLLALALLALFVKVESVVADPLVPLSVFARRGYASVVAIAFIGTVSAAGGTYLMSLFLQIEAGLPAQSSGVLFLPKAIAGLAIGAAMPRLLPLMSVRVAMMLGLAVQALGYILNGMIDPQAPTILTIVSLIIFAAGNITAVVSYTNELTRNWPAEQQGLASGLLIMISSLASGFSVAVDAAVIQPSAPGLHPNLLLGFHVAAGISLFAMVLAFVRGNPHGIERRAGQSPKPVP